MSSRRNRRQFLRDTALAGAGFWVAGGLTPTQGKAANDKINIACIGVGGKGGSDSSHAGRVGQVVALCDIDDNILNGKAREFGDARKFNDFRELLDKMGDKIDAVTVSTPDHTHAAAAVMAMKLGKHVYCQKPLTHTVYEARTMRETAKKHKVCTQMGNQGSAHPQLRRSVELVQAGIIGPVKEVHVWTNRPVWPQAPRITRRPMSTPVPQNVHWDLWIGPAPMRPYSGVRQYNGHGPYHDFNWRGWWDFGTGALGDMACHTMNMPFRALKLGAPTSIVAEAGDLNPETYPAWAKVVYEFPARGDLPAVKLTWYEGKKKDQRVLPPRDLIKGKNFSDSGSLLVGEKGVLYSPDDYGETRTLLLAEGAGKFKEPEKTLPRVGEGDRDYGQKVEWARAIRENKPSIAYSNFDFAGPMTEAILLGNVAIRAGKKLEWDSESFKITNLPEAEKYLRVEYREGWKL